MAQEQPGPDPQQQATDQQAGQAQEQPPQPEQDFGQEADQTIVDDQGASMNVVDQSGQGGAGQQGNAADGVPQQTQEQAAQSQMEAQEQARGGEDLEFQNRVQPLVDELQSLYQDAMRQGQTAYGQGIQQAIDGIHQRFRVVPSAQEQANMQHQGLPGQQPTNVGANQETGELPQSGRVVTADNRNEVQPPPQV